MPDAAEASEAEEERAPAEVHKNWARLIRKVYEVDPLVCPRCGTEMKVIALIERPEVVQRILKHLKLWTSEEDGRAPPTPAAQPEPHVEPLFDDLPWEEPSYDAEGAREDDSDQPFEEQDPSEKESRGDVG